MKYTFNVIPTKDRSDVGIISELDKKVDGKKLLFVTAIDDNRILLVFGKNGDNLVKTKSLEEDIESIVSQSEGGLGNA